MLKGALARRYAQALYEIALKQDLNQVELELKELTRLIDENAEVAHLLYHPHITLTEKKELMDKLFSDSLSDTVRRFISLLIDKEGKIYCLKSNGSLSSLRIKHATSLRHGLQVLHP